MNKAKKLLTITLTVLMLLGTCLCFTGCSVEPYYLDTWYLWNYTDENGESHTLGYDTIKQECLYPDDITIRYLENKTFIFKEFDKEYTGTYTYKNGMKETSVSLTFSDSLKGKGTCARYMFDGTWCVGTLEVFGKKYEFRDDWMQGDKCERYVLPYTEVGKNIINGTETVEVSYYDQRYTLYKGEIELRDEEYWFVPVNLERCDEKNLSQAYELYTYEVAADGSVQRGTNVLREGKCFINFKEYSVTSDSGNVESKCEYAVWYFQDV